MSTGHILKSWEGACLLLFSDAWSLVIVIIIVDVLLVLLVFLIFLQQAEESTNTRIHFEFGAA